MAAIEHVHLFNAIFVMAQSISDSSPIESDDHRAAQSIIEIIDYMDE